MSGINKRDEDKTEVENKARRSPYVLALSERNRPICEFFTSSHVRFTAFLYEFC